MLSFSSIKVYEDTDAREAHYKVQSSKCWYQVVVRPDEVWVRGPGVDETFDVEEDLPPRLSLEGLALAAVVYFEEQE